MQGWATSFPCAVLEGGKGRAGSFPCGETRAGVTLESEPREGPPTLSPPLALGQRHSPPAGLMKGGGGPGNSTTVPHPKSALLPLGGRFLWSSAGQAGGGSKGRSPVTALSHSKNWELLTPPMRRD